MSRWTTVAAVVVAVTMPVLASAEPAGPTGAAVTATAQERLVRVELVHASRGADATVPAPNFSPAGARVPLADVAAAASLPPGARRPARAGVVKVGPDESSWVPVLATAATAHPADLCRLYLDRNRNGDFADDGEPLTATPTAREKTGDVWCSFSGAGFSIPYGRGPMAAVEPYAIDLWIVRQGDAVPDLLRHSVRSWRSGRATIDGVEAFVAAFDMTNNGVFEPADQWSVLEASAPDAARQVLSHAEARPSGRMMFVKRHGAGGAPGGEIVLEFRSITPDGRLLTCAIVDRPVTKAEDRAGDDSLREERPRPRAAAPFAWEATLDAALARGKATGKRVLLDFWTSWCGPCKTLDEWIWTDAEVVAVLNAGYVGVKLDGDLEKAAVKKYGVVGYPTIVVIDPSGTPMKTLGYLGSKEMVAALK